MKFNKWFLLLTLFWALALHAQNKHPIWQVKGQHNSVYLIGSVHVLSQEQYPLPHVFDRVYERSNVVAFEVRLDSLNDAQTQIFLSRYGVFNNDSTLQMALGDSVYAMAHKACTKMGLHIMMFKKMRPWLFSLSLMQFKLRQMHFEPGLGIEQYFFRKAKNDKKSILGVETVNFQLNLLRQFSNLEQKQLVLQTIDELQNFEEEMHQLVMAWQQGNAVQLDSLLNASFSEFPQIYDKLVVQRNQNWFRKIEKFLQQEKPYLIIVGAGHLVGEQGLVRMLQKAGYSVKQL